MSELNTVVGRSLWADARSRLLRNKAAMTSLFLLLALAVSVVVGPWILPWDPAALDYSNIGTAPDASQGHYFGTDGIGRDLLVRTLHGGRVSLMIGLVATAVSLVIGISWGAIAGYFGGRIDNVMMRFVDILYAMPFMFYVILLMVFFGSNIVLIFVAIGSVNWLDMARIVRGQTLSLKRKEFIEAAQVGGVPSLTIIRRHIVPNMLGVVAVYVTLTIPQVILAESFLSFLGLGIQEPLASWGSLVNDGAQEMEIRPWLLIFPSVFLAVTLFCFNFLGDGLRDALDPKDR